jgi:hypothetical protein
MSSEVYSSILLTKYDINKDAKEVLHELEGAIKDIIGLPQGSSIPGESIDHISTFISKLANSNIICVPDFKSCKPIEVLNYANFIKSFNIECAIIDAAWGKDSFTKYKFTQLKNVYQVFASYTDPGDKTCEYEDGSCYTITLAKTTPVAQAPVAQAPVAQTPVETEYVVKMDY